MPIQGTFLADFSSFKAATEQAVAKLKTFEDNASKVTASLTRMGDSLSGVRMIQQATLMAKAVDDVGGVSKLTGAELQRLGSQAAEAIEKMQKTGIKEIPKNLQDIADAAKAAQQPTESLGVSFTKLVGSYVTGQAVLGATKAAFGALTGFVEESIKAAGDAEKAHTQVVAALRAQGTAIPSVISAFQGYATELQRTTIYQDDAIEGAEALLVQIGNVMPQDMQRALKATTDLASGLGIDLDSAVRLVAKSAEGNVTSLKKVGVVVDETKVKQEGFGAVLDAITAKFGGQAAALAGTYEGRLTQLGNTWNNLEESVGRAITTNATVLGLFGELNQVIDQNTGELRDNKTVTDLISESVILAADSIGYFARGLDTIQTVAAGFVIGLLQIDRALGVVALGAAKASAAIALAQGDLNGYRLASAEVQRLQVSLKEESAVIDTITTKSANFGTALQVLAAKSDDLATRLAATRGQVVSLQDRTDGASNAWDRHTQAVVDSGAAERKAAEDAKHLAEEHEKLVAKLFDVEHGLDGAGLGFAKLNELGEKVAIKAPTLADDIEALGRAGEHAGAAFLKMGGQIAGSISFIDASIPNIARARDTLASVQFGGIGPTPDVSPSGNFQIGAAEKKTQDWHKSLNETSQALSQLATISGGTFGGIVKDLSEIVGATNAIGAGFDSIKNSGGGLEGVIGKIGGTLSIVTGAISIAASIAKALNIGGPSKAEVQTRKDRDKAGLTDDKAIQADEDALTRFGASAADAQRIVARALDAKTPEAFAAAMVPVNAALARGAALDKQFSNVTGLVSAYENAGHVIPASMLETIKTLQKLPGLTDAERDSLQALADGAKPNFDALEAVAEKYGATLQGLGPKLSQGQIDQTAQGIFQDFTDLTNAGGEAGNVLTAMQGKIGDLVKQAEDSGGAVPAFLKDILGNFGDTITDSHGDIIDLTKITFDDTPTADGLQGMQDQLTTLQGQLTTDIPDAIHTLLSQIPENPFAGWHVPGVPTTGGSDASHASTGGLVTASGVQHFAGGGTVLNFPGAPSGVDTVPIWASPGEMVLTKDQQQAIGQSGGGVIEIHTTVDVDGRELARTVSRHQATELNNRTRRRAA